MKRFLAWIMTITLALTPVMAGVAFGETAEGTMIFEYPRVDISILPGAQAFRDYVKSVAADFFNGKYDQGTEGYSRYYYGASDVKHNFDNSLWNRNLAYSTNENSKRDYEQETQEIVVYMLSQNVQQKVTTMKNRGYNAEEFFVGMTFDPTTGEWKVGEQGINVQEEFNAEITNMMDKCNAEMFSIFCETFFDLGGNGSQQEMADLIIDMISACVGQLIDFRTNQQKALLQDMYYDVMVEDMKAALENVDAQVFAGLVEMKAKMDLEKKSLSSDDLILYDSLDKVLKYIHDGRALQDLKNETITDGAGNTATVDSKLLELAENFVKDDMGISEAIMPSEEDLIRDMTINVVESVFDKLIDEIPDESQNGLEAVKAVAVDALSGLIMDISFTGMEVDGLDGYGVKDAVKGLINAETLSNAAEELSTVKINSHIKEVDSWEEIIAKIKDFGNEYKPYSDTKHVSNKLQEFESHAMKKIEDNGNKMKEWDTFKQNIPFLKSALKVVESTIDVASATASSFDILDNEVYFSYYASAMYRARQLAEKNRTEFRKAYEGYRDSDMIDKAELSDLKSFLNSAYTILNTDMLGHAYYTTLAVSYHYQVSDERDKDIEATVQQLREMRQKSYREQFGWFAPAAWVLGWNDFSLGVSEAAAKVQVSEYLQKVNKEKRWLSSKDCETYYEYIASMAERCRIPAEYVSLISSSN